MNNALAWVLMVLGVAALVALGHVAANVYPGTAQREAMIKAQIERDLDALGYDWASVSFSGGDVVLTGAAPSTLAKTAAEDVVSCALTGETGFALTSALTLPAIPGVPDPTPDPAAPDLPDWGAEITDPGSVRLFGRVPSDAIRLSIVEAAQNAFPESVLDQMSVGDLASPEGLWERVAAGFGQFGRFSRGLFSFDLDDGVRVEGEAPQSAITFLREDLSGVADVDIAVDILSADLALTELDGLTLDETASVDLCGEAFERVMAENSVAFETGSATIDRVSGEVLDKIMTVARSCDRYAIEVQGHTDSDGSAEFNQILSQQRADAVVAYLSESGFPASQLVGAGYGETQPIADNATEDGKAQNRRIDFVVSAP